MQEKFSTWEYLGHYRLPSFNDCMKKAFIFSFVWFGLTKVSRAAAVRNLWMDPLQKNLLLYFKDFVLLIALKKIPKS